MIFEGNGYDNTNNFTDQKESTCKYSKLSQIQTSTPFQKIENTTTKSSHSHQSIILSIENNNSYKIKIGINTIGRSSKTSIPLIHASIFDTSRIHCSIYYDGFDLGIESNSLQGETKILRGGDLILLKHNQRSPLYVGDTIQFGLTKGKIHYGLGNSINIPTNKENVSLMDKNLNEGGVSIRSQTIEGLNESIPTTTTTTTTTTTRTTKDDSRPRQQPRIHRVLMQSYHNTPLYSSLVQDTKNIMKKVDKKQKKKKIMPMNSLSLLFDKINFGSSLSNNYSDVDQNEIDFGNDRLSFLFDKISFGSSLSNNYSDVDQNEINFGNDQSDYYAENFEKEKEYGEDLE
ncbi:hypothetical protein RB653_003011 [Dictyostelium firmibasis]|uniref:FHA domain-containing protein n=1 Tax=Dictyostelium firmibasis TaxID=79012 RepID=A0AAN7YZ61_9MYCE